MPEIINVEELFSDDTLNLALDTIRIGKQALVFVNTKRSAESVAEKIADKIKNIELTELSNKALKALSRPTKQCERLAYCLKRGVAFHHSGLVSDQRKLVENNFRGGDVRIICCTPTLAYGLNLPAFRSIIRDLSRYGGRWGNEPIAVLEYLQMAGRAGRPGKETFGEAICMAKTESEKEKIVDAYIHGLPEDIYSKLAAEPVLRTYILSLVASGFVKNTLELENFFEKTYWAHQYEDMRALTKILYKMINLLREWEFLKEKPNDDGFTDAVETFYEKLEATPMGKRVAELYIDPLTANFIINCLKRAEHLKLADEFSYMHMISSTLEMRPIFKAGVKEIVKIEERLALVEDDLLYPAPSIYDMEYDDFLNTIKTAVVFEEWINEADEQEILEDYNVKPGEFKAKLDEANWILYATDEFATLLGFHNLKSQIKKTKIRLSNGVKEELLPLIRLKNIGRMRARTLYKNGIRSVADIVKIDITSLTQILGPNLAKDLKKQVGEEAEDEISPKKRVGQMGLGKYDKD